MKFVRLNQARNASELCTAGSRHRTLSELAMPTVASCRAALCCLVAVLLWMPQPAAAQDLSLFDDTVETNLSADDLFRVGRYEEALTLAKAEFDAGVWNEKWPRLLIVVS